MAELVGQLLMGWLLADLVTGMFHWWEDRFGDESWPIVGHWIIAPNRLHHTDPLAFTSHGFLERNLASIIAAAFAVVALLSIGDPEPWVASFAAGGALANEVHRYAHQPSASPAWLRVLQEIGICQSPKVHAVHHRPPNDRSFCVLTNYLNPLLEAVGLWRALEYLFRR